MVSFGEFNSNELYLITARPRASSGDWQYGSLGLFISTRHIGSIFNDFSVTWVKPEHWTTWGECSKLCDGGTQSRARVKNGYKLDSNDLTTNQNLASKRPCNKDNCPSNGEFHLIGAFGENKPTSGLLTLYYNGSYVQMCQPKGITAETLATMGDVACASMKLGKFKRIATFDDSDMSNPAYRNNSRLDNAKMHDYMPWTVTCSSDAVFNTAEDIINKCTMREFRVSGCRTSGDSIVLTCRPRVDGWSEWSKCSQDCYAGGQRGTRRRQWITYTNASRNDDVAICNTEPCPADKTIQLEAIDGANEPNVGLVKVFHMNTTETGQKVGVWGTMCNDFFSPSVGKVICRSVGYNSFVEKIRPSTFMTRFGLRSDYKERINQMDILYDDITCKGTERHLSECHFV